MDSRRKNGENRGKPGLSRENCGHPLHRRMHEAQNKWISLGHQILPFACDSAPVFSAAPPIILLVFAGGRDILALSETKRI
jgi:hypothetical protein